MTAGDEHGQSRLSIRRGPAASKEVDLQGPPLVDLPDLQDLPLQLLGGEGEQALVVLVVVRVQAIMAVHAQHRFLLCDPRW